MDDYNSTRLDCTRPRDLRLCNCTSFSGLRRSLNNLILLHMPPNKLREH
jgi:hypothetical protein